MARRESRYALTCPHCSQATVETAKHIWVLRGLIIAFQHGSITIVGCELCVREKALAELWANLALGWWSLLSVFLNPLVLLQNVLQIATRSSPQTLESALRKAGIDLDEVRIDERGLSGEQRRMLEAAFVILQQSIRADGRVLDSELELAVAIIDRLTGSKVVGSEAIDGILLADPSAVSAERLSLDYRVILLSMAVDVSVTDQHLSPEELGYLRSISETLGLGWPQVQQMIDDRRRPPRDRPRRSDRLSKEVRWAVDTLGVREDKNVREIKAAYRRRMLESHPDRAGADKHRREMLHEMAIGINRAYEVLMRHAGAR